MRGDLIIIYYRLRQSTSKRTTELFIVVTMYNEDEKLFLKTWKSLCKNIDTICKNKTWGEDGWKKIVVCIVSDGRTKIHEKTLATLGVLGAYQEGLIKTSVNGEGMMFSLDF
jgi:chitin synthase